MASFKSVLSTIGSDVKKVFAWLGSPQATNVITTGEAAVEDVFPAASGLINLANAGLKAVITTEGLAAGAAQQEGSGVTKLAAATAAATPAALAYAQSLGLPAPTTAEIQTAINGLVAFANAFAVPATTNTGTTAN